MNTIEKLPRPIELEIMHRSCYRLSMIERRKHERIDGNWKVAVTRIPEEIHGHDRDVYQTIDISRSGFRLRTFQPLEAESQVRVTVQSDDAPDQMLLLGVVRWAHKVQAEGTVYDVGVELFDLENEDGRAWIKGYEVTASHS